MKTFLDFAIALAIVGSTFSFKNALAQETDAARQPATRNVSSEELRVFMQKWKPYEPFKYPDDPKDEPLLLAALKKEPGDPWTTYLGIKFSFDKYEARKLSAIARAQKFRETLSYLEPARKILLNATKGRPNDIKLLSSLQQIKQAITQASLETDADLVKLKGTTQALLDSNGGGNVWQSAEVVYDANVNLGRIALREGNIEAAKRHLLAAVRTQDSTQLNSFEPDFILARELLEKGEKEVVFQFLGMLERFWADVEKQRPGDAKLVAEANLKKLETWREQIRKGNVPDDPKWK